MHPRKVGRFELSYWGMQPGQVPFALPLDKCIFSRQKEPRRFTSSQTMKDFCMGTVPFCSLKCTVWSLLPCLIRLNQRTKILKKRNHGNLPAQPQETESKGATFKVG